MRFKIPLYRRIELSEEPPVSEVIRINSDLGDNFYECFVTREGVDMSVVLYSLDIPNHVFEQWCEGPQEIVERADWKREGF